MIIERLSIENFRVFNGLHTFDLAPRVKYNKKRPIVLFGGLNGAGKTTTLTAVRLALYGKQAMGTNISQSDYYAYLKNSINRPKRNTEAPKSASIELTFSYASMGVITHYTVKRSWRDTGKGTTEKLSISEDGHSLSELNSEQCQGFLNELIPIGVSDLFFFDGEKIAELAEDTKGSALGDSVKKLLGLDLIETLDSDLSILLRSEAKKSSSAEAQKKIAQLETKLKQLEDAAEHELSLYEQEKPIELEAINKLNKLELELSSKGGAWAQTRESEVKLRATLSEEKRLLEENLREILAGSYPLSLATSFAESTLEQLHKEANSKRASHVADAIKQRVTALDRSLKHILSEEDYTEAQEVISDNFGPLLRKDRQTSIIHDISDTMLSTIENVITDAKTTQRNRLLALSERLHAITEELDNVESNISRAPEQAQIQPLLLEIAKETRVRVESTSKQKQYIENHKRLLREAISVARQLDKETSTISSEMESTRASHFASSSKSLLADFKDEMAKRKVQDLEERFVESFSKLARKEDINLRATIDPSSFTVRLLGEDGNEIDKDELSAGEKQIYAIAILEALARTSGRRLPIIIDTPLGRLDSIHRTKLVENYFPTASHQVIILSTDTEVDEAFYSELSPNISHAYRLDYDGSTGCTSAAEGYFWRD